MQLQTRKILDELAHLAWFRNVGQHDIETMLIVASWHEAIESCRSLSWENLQLEAANQYRARLLECSKEHFKLWNAIVTDVKPLVESLVERKIAVVVDINKFDKVFVDSVKWDILHLAVETEYADICSPGFFTILAQCYRSGHFPCGWQGNYPDGRLVIY